jgi:hypothetical protein
VKRALIVLLAVILNGAWLQQACAAQACAWIVETVEDGGAHQFELNLSADAPTSVSSRFAGPGFTSASMGGDMIQLAPGEAKDVDGEGFDVSAGDDLVFDVQLFDHPLASIDEMKNPTGRPLATFSFHSKAGADGHARPADLAKQCKPLG